MTKVTATIGKQLRYLALTQSTAVTDDAVEPISTCSRLEVLDLQGTRIEVKKKSRCNIEEPAVRNSCFFQAAGLASLLGCLPQLRQLISSLSIPSLLPLVPSNLTLAIQICQPPLPDIFHSEEQVERKDDHTPILLQMRDLAARCPQIKMLHHYNNPEDPSDFGFLVFFSHLSSLTLSGGR